MVYLFRRTHIWFDLSKTYARWKEDYHCMVADFWDRCFAVRSARWITLGHDPGPTLRAALAMPLLVRVPFCSTSMWSNTSWKQNWNGRTSRTHTVHCRDSAKTSPWNLVSGGFLLLRSPVPSRLQCTQSEAMRLPCLVPRPKRGWPDKGAFHYYSRQVANKGVTQPTTSPLSWMKQKENCHLGSQTSWSGQLKSWAMASLNCSWQAV